MRSCSAWQILEWDRHEDSAENLASAPSLEEANAIARAIRDSQHPEHDLVTLHRSPALRVVAS